jgi:uncharacterized protein (TIGR02598 family)
MNSRTLRSTGFSLVEVTFALGVAGFCLIAVFGLLPVGMRTNQDAISQTASTVILAAVIADMRATPKSATASTQFGVSFGSEKKLYFDGEGAFVPDQPSTTSRYRLIVTFRASPAGGATYAHLRVTWPAAAEPTNASGASEAFAAFDRH